MRRLMGGLCGVPISLLLPAALYLRTVASLHKRPASSLCAAVCHEQFTHRQASRQRFFLSFNDCVSLADQLVVFLTRTQGVLALAVYMCTASMIRVLMPNSVDNEA
jgi:hypothetical protein